MSKSAKATGFDTKLIHAGEPKPRFGGAVSLPIFQSATFEHTGQPVDGEIRYIRLNNTPNHLALEQKLAALEQTDAALVTASGMAAIATTLLTVLSRGDHLLVQRSLYGGTYGFLTEECRAMDIEVGWIDADRPDSWAGLLRPSTRAIYVETMSNPLLEVPDLEAVVAFAKAHSLVSMIDNTFASPVNFCPWDIGIDLSLHSATKYLNGHDDIVAGAVLGSVQWISRIRKRLNHLGGALDPHAAFLLQRGLKTLGVRVRYQNASALRIAQFLEQHPAISRVHYPGLEGHRHHARARRLFRGYGGTLSFELPGGDAAAARLMAALCLPIPAPSLGGVDSLVMLPALISHVGLTAEERKEMGIGDGLVRLSVGLETTDDLIDDLAQALRA